MKTDYSQTRQWEKDCIKTRRNIWLRKRRLKMFDFQPKDYILDLGCGDGINIKILKEMGIKNIVGVDISEFLLDKAKKLNPDLKFVLASADELPFKKNTFDNVLVDSVFHHLTNNKRSIEEIKRVLKKDGRLYFIEPHASIMRKLLDLLTVSPINLFIPFLKARKEAYLAEKEAIQNWLNEENNFLKDVDKRGLKKKFLKYDLFSVVGEYIKK